MFWTPPRAPKGSARFCCDSSCTSASSMACRPPPCIRRWREDSTGWSALGRKRSPPHWVKMRTSTTARYCLPEGLLLYRADGEARTDLEGPLILALSSALRAALLRGRLKQQSFAINYRGVELEALYDVGLAIASMLDMGQLGEEILLRAVSLLDARRGALYLRSGSRYLLDHTLGGDARRSCHSRIHK